MALRGPQNVVVNARVVHDGGMVLELFWLEEAVDLAGLGVGSISLLLDLGAGLLCEDC